MASLILSIVSLIISLLAVAISFVALLRDRPKIRVTVEPAEGEREVSARVVAKNHGKRPIDISYVSVHKRGQSGPSRRRSFDRKLGDPIRLEEGQCASTDVRSGDRLHVWNTLEELNQCVFVVEDALGNKHRAQEA